MRVTIRPYRQSDANTFLGLVKALADFERLAPPTPAACRRLRRDVGRRIEVLMAEAGGQPAGYAIHLFTYSSFLGRPTLFLEDLFVLPEFRKLGIGKRLVEALRRIARRAKCGRMEWLVLGWNKPAIRFYEAIGARHLREWRPYRLKP
jgi:GNAT superfamily N-acetyltransferase